MLPPDTSSTLFPWRVMVPVMQVYGCFPYRMSDTGQTPTFSLPLRLWSVFIFMTHASMSCLGLREKLLVYIQQDYAELGIIAYTSSTVFMMAVICLTPSVMSMRSHQLAQLLHDMSKITEVSPPSGYRWYCKPQTQFVLFLGIVLTIFSAFTAFHIGQTNIAEGLVFVPVSILGAMSFVMPEEVSSMVFGLLGRRLVAATEATVASVSMLLTPDGSFKSERDLEAAMLDLCDLDAVVREVELHRDIGVRCFFPVITMLLLMAVLQAIASPYALVQGFFMQGSTIILLGVACYVMGRFCHMGQTFVNQVSTVKRLLGELTVKSHILSINLKVNQLTARLSDQLAFDMCGWYRLDYASLLRLINTVLTYLVIVLQVGGTNVISAPSPTNSSASADHTGP